MTWLANLFSRPSTDDAEARAQLPASTDPTPRPSEDVESAIQRRLSHGPTDRFTPHQFFYIFIIDGLGAFILSGGINFAIAYGEPSLPLPYSPVTSAKN